MKARFCSAIAVVCLAFSAPAAFAAPISANVTAQVFQIYDPANLLGGQVSIDQAGRGRFNYESSVPDGHTSGWAAFQLGTYAQSPSQASLAFTLGALVFETDASSPNWMFEVSVWDAEPNTGNQDFVRIYGMPYKPVPGLPGVEWVQVMYQFADYNGSAIWSDAMPNGVPELWMFPASTVVISGGGSGGYFEVRLMMQTVQPSAAAELTVSPAPGAFVRQQPIVPALLLPAGTQVAAIEGSFNGYEMPSYFASCSLTNTVLRVAFVCPDLNYNLVPGINRVEWRVRLLDGSITPKVVEWEIVQ
jgi:hypothetical protein